MPNVRWKEPAAFKRASQPPLRWQPGIAIAVLIMAAILVGRATVSTPKAPGWPWVVLIAVGAGGGIGLLLPWLTSLVPSEVTVSPKGINRNGFDGVVLRIQFWPWDRIARCSLEQAEFNGSSFQVLALYDAQGKRDALALGAGAPLAELEAFFAAQHKPMERGMLARRPG